MELGREADNGHSLARLKPMNQVGGKADTCGGLSTDTAFLFGNGAEGVVAVEPEAVFHANFASGTLQPNSGIKIGQMDERFSAKCGNWKNNLYICSSYRGDSKWKKCIKKG